MKLNLDLAYRVAEGAETEFIDAAEADTINRRIAAVLAELPATLPREDRQIQAQIVGREVREAAFADLRRRLGARISSLLLRTAVERLKYKEKIPRSEGARTPGKWWGAILDDLDDRPEALELSAAKAQWLVDVWADDAVQNGFEPRLQSWVNVLDDELARLRAELDAPKG